MLYVEPEWIAKLQFQILNDNNNTFRPFQITHTDCPFIYRGFQSLAHTLIEDESTIKVEQTALNFFSELILKDTNNPSLNVISKKKQLIVHINISQITLIKIFLFLK